MTCGTSPIPLKQWLHEQASHLKIKPVSLYSRLRDYGWPGIQLDRRNARVVLVTRSNPPRWIIALRRQGNTLKPTN